MIGGSGCGRSPPSYPAWRDRRFISLAMLLRKRAVGILGSYRCLSRSAQRLDQVYNSYLDYLEKLIAY
jgi:hypothetical protein